MSMIETPMMKMLGRFLDVTAFRHGVIACNMANVDTPNYRTADIDFRSAVAARHSTATAITQPTVEGRLRIARSVLTETTSVWIARALAHGAEPTAVSCRSRALEKRTASCTDGDQRRSAMNLFGVLGISASALTAQRQRAEVVTANMANAETTQTVEGGPYRRKQVVFSNLGNSTSPFSRYRPAGQPAGPREAYALRRWSAIQRRRSSALIRSHPDADERGYVAYPNINPVTEMVDLMGAVRSYQLNASAVNASKQMIQQSIDLLRKRVRS